MNILCIGDVSEDAYDTGELFFGGCTLNVARQLFEKLEHKQTGIYAPMGTDSVSLKARAFLESTGMEVRLKIIEGDCPRQPIKIDSTGDRELYNYHEGILPEFSCRDLGGIFFLKWQMILFPYYKQVENMVESILELDLKTSLACDFGNLSDYGGKLERTEKILNKLIYAQFSSRKPIKQREAFFLEHSNNKVIVDTHGPYGVTAYKNGQKIFMEAPHVLQVTDTTGAGDAFFAHFIYAKFVKDYDLKKSLEFALQGGAAQVGHLGPGPYVFS